MNPIQASGAINQLEGYVAEQVVAAKLVAQGHQVVFPEISNQQGWDLLVDGQEFQVKCLQDLDGLAEHFSKFVHPVVANAELAEAIAQQAPAWADKVFFLEGYSHQLIAETTQVALDAGVNLLNPHVPVFALGVGAAHNIWAYVRGQITATKYLTTPSLASTINPMRPEPTTLQEAILYFSSQVNCRRVHGSATLAERRHLPPVRER